MKKSLKKTDSNYFRAFTILELVIVIIIIGILASTISVSIPNNTLQIESDKMQNYFRTANSVGLKYDGWDYQKNFWSAVCFEINQSSNTISAYIQHKDSKEYLKDALSGKNIKDVKFKTKLTATFQKICFSPFGDLFENNISKENLIVKKNYITLSDGTNTKTLTIEATGFIH